MKMRAMVLREFGDALISAELEVPRAGEGQVLVRVNPLDTKIRAGRAAHARPMLTGNGREHHGEILAAVADLVDEKRLRPLLDERIYRMAEVAAAHAAVESGARSGKVVVSVRG